MKFEETEVHGFRAAFRGMRNPMNSWDKSDSWFATNTENNNDKKFIIGENDLKLAQTLIRAGKEHMKYLRMIQVWVDLTFPRYIWSEFDTYKYNTKNSCSTMHKLFDKRHEISLDDFELNRLDKIDSLEETVIKDSIENLNFLKNNYFKTQDQATKDNILTFAKRILPESYLQKRTINTNYAELRNIYFQRKNHRLKEWHKICRWIETLPYAKELILYTGENANE